MAEHAPAPGRDPAEDTLTLLRAMQARVAKALQAGERVPASDGRALVELTERVQRVTHRPRAELATPGLHADPGRYPRVRCSARSSRTGKPCRAWAVHGAGVCSAHGGLAPQVRARAERRTAEVEIRRTLGVPLEVDPADAILHAVYEAAGNVALLREHVQDERNTRAVYDYQGKPHTNPVLAFYNEERDRLARFSKLAADMNIDERRVRLAEAEGRALAGVVQAAVDACDPTPAERAAALHAAGERMRALGAGAAAPA